MTGPRAEMGPAACFLAGRWLVWLTGALLGIASQLLWLSDHHWDGPVFRLSLGLLMGAAVLWGLAEGLHWLLRLRYKSLWRHLEPLGAAMARGAWELSGLYDWRGRRVWIAACLVLTLAAGAAWWHWRLQPAEGERLVRELFLAHVSADGRGLWAVLRPGVDGMGPMLDLGLVEQFNYPDLAALAGAREHNYRLHLLGALQVERAGPYRFAGVVDDGLELLIDGRVVFSRLDVSSTRRLEGELWLEPGQHAVEATYVQYRGGAVLKITWQPPGGTEEPLPAANLRPLGPGFPLAQSTVLRLTYGLVPSLGSTYDPLLAGRHWRLPW